jgi:hypothetical protein
MPGNQGSTGYKKNHGGTDYTEKHREKFTEGHREVLMR